MSEESSPKISTGVSAEQAGKYDSLRNWPEDFGHENGQYLNRCIRCEQDFIGHKRRVICKQCAVHLVDINSDRAVVSEGERPEVKKKFFITHVGHVTVSNYGVVEFELPGFLYGEPRRVIWSVDTLYEMARESRASVAEMRKEKVYAR